MRRAPPGPTGRFSGGPHLQAQEVPTLAWSQLSWEPEFEGWTAAVERARPPSFPSRWPCGGLVGAAPTTGGRGRRRREVRVPEGQQETAHGVPDSTHRPKRLCQADFPRAQGTDLLSACAAWLKEKQQLFDHEVARVLGGGTHAQTNLRILSEDERSRSGRGDRRSSPLDEHRDHCSETTKSYTCRSASRQLLVRGGSLMRARSDPPRDQTHFRRARGLWRQCARGIDPRRSSTRS